MSNTFSFITDKPPFEKRVVVTKASDLAGTLDGNKEYFIDGIIDMGSQSIEVPVGGLNLTGFNLNLSKLISSEDNYTMFTSPTGGSGDLLGKDYAIEVTGTGSKVYDLESATGFNAFEFARINYNNCSSLGEINSYRQGLETGTGRFGGKPTLTLSGSWVGGYFIDTSIVRNLDAAMTEPLFKAGTNFTMQSRFRSNQNVDLPANASFIDFYPSNFPNSSTVQLTQMIVSRNGAFNANDSNLIPNMAAGDLCADWNKNLGLKNTFVGGRLKITSESATVIFSGSTFYDLNATWTASGLQHFSNPSNGVLEHDGVNPNEFQIQAELTLECITGNVLELRWAKYKNSTGNWEHFGNIKRQVNALVGTRDVSFFTVLNNVRLDTGDKLKLQVSNNNGNNNVTAEIDGLIIVKAR